MTGVTNNTSKGFTRDRGEKYFGLHTMRSNTSEKGEKSSTVGLMDEVLVDP